MMCFRFFSGVYLQVSQSVEELSKGGDHEDELRKYPSDDDSPRSPSPAWRQTAGRRRRGERRNSSPRPGWDGVGRPTPGRGTGHSTPREERDYSTPAGQTGRPTPLSRGGRSPLRQAGSAGQGRSVSPAGAKAPRRWENVAQSSSCHPAGRASRSPPPRQSVHSNEREGVAQRYPYGPGENNEFLVVPYPSVYCIRGASHRRPRWTDFLVNNGQFINPEHQLMYSNGIDASRFNFALFTRSMSRPSPSIPRVLSPGRKTCVLITDGGVGKVLMTKPENCVMGQFSRQHQRWDVLNVQGFDASHMFREAPASDQWEIFQVSLVGMAIGAHGPEGALLAGQGSTSLWKKVRSFSLNLMS